jgi:hypothetical protein
MPWICPGKSVCPGELYMISIVCSFGVGESLVSFKCLDPSDIHYKNFMAPPGEKELGRGLGRKVKNRNSRTTRLNVNKETLTSL